MIYSKGSNKIEVAQIGPLRNGFIIPSNVLVDFNVERFEAEYGPSNIHYLGSNGYLEVVGSELKHVSFAGLKFPIHQSNFDSEVARKFLKPDMLIGYSFSGNQTTYMGIIERNSLIDPSIDFSRFNIQLFRPG